MDLLISKLGQTGTGVNIPVALHVLLFSTEHKSRHIQKYAG